MPPDQEQGSAKAKPSTDQASSSGKSKSSRRRSSHEQHRSRDEAEAEVPEAVREDPGPKQVMHRSEMPAKSKKSMQGGDGANHRSAASSEKQQEVVEVVEASHRGSKRRQNQGGEGDAVEVVASVRSSKRWRSESAVVLAGPPTPPSPLDRWDGGQSQVEIGVAPLPSFDTGKQIANPLDASVLDGIGNVTPVNVAKERAGEGDSKSRKGKFSASRAVVALESRQIATVNPAESIQIDGIISEANTRVKNKASRKKDIEVIESEQEKGPRKTERDLVEAVMPQVLEQNAADLGSNRSRKIGNRRRWDGETSQKEKERMNLHPPDHDLTENRERDKRKDKGGESRDSESSRFEKEHVLEDLEPPAAKGRSEDSDKRRRSSEDRDLRTSEWKIQEELRNIELEKELENRIRRRKEESSERDRWKDDDRDRESRRHIDHREDRVREQRHKDERSRREKHGDRHESKNYREGSKSLEGKSREDRSHETERDYKLSRNESIGHKKDDLEQIREADRDLDQDTRERRVQSSKDVAIDAEHRGRSKSYKEEIPEKERIGLKQSISETDDAGKREHVQKRARETLSIDSGIKEREQSRKKAQEKDSQVDCEESDAVLEDKVHLRNRDERDREGSLERLSDHPREQQRGRSRSERRFDNRSTDGIMSPYYESRASPSSRLDGSSPVADDRVPSIYSYQRSPSPAVFEGNRPVSRIKPVRGEWLESTYSMSSSSGTQRRRDSGLHIRDRGERSRRHTVAEEEVKSGDLGGSRKVLDEVRDGSPSPRRSQDYHLPLPPLGPQSSRQEGFSRVSAGRNAIDMRNVSSREEAVSRDQEPWRAAFQSGMTNFDTRGSDELFPRDRVERARHGLPVNRPISSPMARAQLASLQAPSLAPLPPPPPFRQGIDNPSILGPPGSVYEEGSGSRDQGRLDRKPNIPHRRGEAAGTLGRGDAWRGVAIGNWNSRNQGPGPGNAFPPYQPHHYGGHPPAGFPGIGQQFSGPPIFGPGGVGRAPMDMNFGGGRFIGPGNRLGDGEAFHVQGRGSGWRGPGDDDIRPPVLGPVEGWDGQGHLNDEVRHGWDRTVGPMGGRPWERDRDVWDGRPRDANMDFIPRAQIDPPHQGFISGQGASWGIPFEVKVGEGKVFDNPVLARGEQQEKCEVASSKGTSEDSVTVKPSEDDKVRTRAIAAMRRFLSKLDISAELAGPELYSQYKSFVSASTTAATPNIHVKEETEASDLSDYDCSLDVDLEAEALLSRSRLPNKLFPPVPEGAFEAALSAYRKSDEENRIQKSAIGSFILPFNPKSAGLHHLVMQPLIQQPATPNKVLLDTATTSAVPSDIGSGTVDDVSLKAEVHGANGMVILQKLSQSCDIALTPEGAVSLEVTEHSDRDILDTEMEDKLYEDSLGPSQNVDSDAFVVEGKQEPANVQELHRDSMVLDDNLIAEEVETLNSQVYMHSDSYEPLITLVTQFETDCSEACEPSNPDELVTLVEYSEAPGVGDSLQFESTVSKGNNDEQNVEESGTFCSGDGIVICDSNGEIKQPVDYQAIGDQKIVIESEKVCNESEECFAEVKQQTFLEKHVGHEEAGIYVEEGVKAVKYGWLISSNVALLKASLVFRELACFMYILKRNRIFIRIRTFQLTTWFHRRLDILTVQLSTIHQVTRQLVDPMLIVLG